MGCCDDTPVVWDATDPAEVWEEEGGLVVGVSLLSVWPVSGVVTVGRVIPVDPGWLTVDVSLGDEVD